MGRTMILIGGLICLVLAIGVATAGSDTGIETRHWRTNADPLLGQDPAAGPAEYLVLLDRQADLSAAAGLASKAARGRHVFTACRSLARDTQAPLLALLQAAGADHRSYWIINLIWVRGDASLMEALARHPAVARIQANPRVRLAAATPASPTATSTDSHPFERNVEWNIAHVGGPEVWAAGVTGVGAVVGGIDTGYAWDHPALLAQYRGWDGNAAEHDYNWHDAIHDGGGPCGPDAPEPCDDNGHGTHTLGTMVGDDGGANQIGLAPGARWIGCRCLSEGWGTAATFIECLEWMLAPYPVGGSSEEGLPELAPHVINCSWSCPEVAGCAWDTLLPAITALRAAGIVVVASGGGGGPGCGSIDEPPAIYDEALTVSATDQQDQVTSFAGRGPVEVDDSGRIKPDVCAPAVAVRSAWPDGDYHYLTGTSTAAPLVAGLIALLVAADPSLAGDVDQLENLVTAGAVPLISGQCGDGTAVPNNVYGHGRIDALASVGQILVGVGEPTAPAASAWRLLPNQPNPFNPRTTIAFEAPTPGPVSLRIYDLSGRLVRTLIAGEAVGAGRHSRSWNGRDENGRPVAAGCYFYRLSSGIHSQTRRMVLVN